jgi:hypothetical protein
VPAELYQDAARLCLTPVDLADHREELALVYLSRAVEHGLDPTRLNDALYQRLESKPAYQRLRRGRPQKGEPVRLRRVINPLVQGTSHPTD